MWQNVIFSGLILLNINVFFLVFFPSLKELKDRNNRTLWTSIVCIRHFQFSMEKAPETSELLCPKLHSSLTKRKPLAKFFLWFAIVRFEQNHWINISVKMRHTNHYISTVHWRTKGWKNKRGGKMAEWTLPYKILSLPLPFPRQNVIGNIVLPLSFYSNSEQKNTSWRFLLY